MPLIDGVVLRVVVRYGVQVEEDARYPEPDTISAYDDVQQARASMSVGGRMLILGVAVLAFWTGLGMVALVMMK